MHFSTLTITTFSLLSTSLALPHLFNRAPAPHAFPQSLSFDDTPFSFTRGGVNTRPRPTGTGTRPTGTRPTGRPTGIGFPTRSLPTKIVPKPTTKTRKGGPKPTSSCKESVTGSFPNATASTVLPSFTLISSSVTLPTFLPSTTESLVTSGVPTMVTSEAPTGVTSEAPTGITSEAPTGITSVAPPAETSTAPGEVEERGV